MGAAFGKAEGDGPVVRRGGAITGGGAVQKKGLPKLPPNAVKAAPEDYPILEVRMVNLVNAFRHVMCGA